MYNKILRETENIFPRKYSQIRIGGGFRPLPLVTHLATPMVLRYRFIYRLSVLDVVIYRVAQKK